LLTTLRQSNGRTNCRDMRWVINLFDGDLSSYQAIDLYMMGIIFLSPQEVQYVTVMNLLHDSSHVVFWAAIAALLPHRPLLSGAAYALAGLTALWTARNIVRREYILRRRKESD